MIIKTEDQNFDRDRNSFALINTNEREYAKHKERKRQAQRGREIEDDIKSLKDDIREMKDLLLGMNR